jgi:hypothetical protein
MLDPLDPIPSDDDGSYAEYYKDVANRQRKILAQFKKSILNHQLKGYIWEKTKLRWSTNELGQYLSPCCQKPCRWEERSVSYMVCTKSNVVNMNQHGPITSTTWCGRAWRVPPDMETDKEQGPYGYEIGKTPSHLR